ncbi:hypothetical protein ACA31_08740 [Staphylococcus sp. NAM3COL9]|nr:hypothetical protein ACA31_08740 [Staphylococcus sp. NAM3COL9]
MVINKKINFIIAKESAKVNRKFRIFKELKTSFYNSLYDYVLNIIFIDFYAGGCCGIAHFLLTFN